MREGTASQAPHGGETLAAGEVARWCGTEFHPADGCGCAVGIRALATSCRGPTMVAELQFRASAHQTSGGSTFDQTLSPMRCHLGPRGRLASDLDARVFRTDHGRALPLSSAYRLLVDWRSHSESPGLQARFCLTPPAPSSTRRAARPSDECPRLPLFSPALPRQTRGVRFANHARRGRVSHARGPIEDGEVIRVRAAAKGRDGLPTSPGSRVASTELLRGMAHPGCAVVVAASLRLVERFPKGFPPRGSRGGSREGLRPRTLSRGIAIARRARAVRFPRVSRPLLPLAPGKHCFRHLRGRNRDACTSDRAAARITITA